MRLLRCFLQSPLPASRLQPLALRRTTSARCDRPRTGPFDLLEHPPVSHSRLPYFLPSPRNVAKAQPGCRFTGELKKGEKDGRGHLSVTARESSAPTTETFKFRCFKLDKKDFFGKSDPYLTVLRRDHGVLDSYAWSTLYKSDVIKNNLNPSFPVSAGPLCDSAPLSRFVLNRQCHPVCRSFPFAEQPLGAPRQ